MARFSETQTTLLSAAAAQESRSLLPPPETLKATGKALDRTFRRWCGAALLPRAGHATRPALGAGTTKALRSDF